MNTVSTKAVAWLPLAAVGLGLLAACGGGSGDGNTSATSAAAPVTLAASTTAAPAQPEFTASLDGGQEVPPQATSAIGTGSANIDPGTLLFSAAVAIAGTTATTVSVRQAPPGLVGPLLFLLNQTAPGSGVWTGAAALTVLQADALAAGNLYFEAQSAAFPTGEIRGRIIPSSVAANQLLASLTATTAIVSPGTTSGIGTTNTGTQTVIGTTAGIGTPNTPATIAVGSNAGIGTSSIGFVTPVGTAAGIGTAPSIGAPTASPFIAAPTDMSSIASAGVGTAPITSSVTAPIPVPSFGTSATSTILP